jgi:hypothetical protein
MTDTSNTNPKQWMEDVNEQLDGLMDDMAKLEGKTKTNMLVAGAAIALAGVQGIGMATLFKGQKAIVETLSAVVNKLEPAPMSPEDIARAQAAMGQPTVTVDNHKGPDVVLPQPMVVTETMGDTAPPAETPKTESSGPLPPTWADDNVDDLT